MALAVALCLAAPLEVAAQSQQHDSFDTIELELEARGRVEASRVEHARAPVVPERRALATRRVVPREPGTVSSGPREPERAPAAEHDADERVWFGVEADAGVPNLGAAGLVFSPAPWVELAVAVLFNDAAIGGRWSARFMVPLLDVVLMNFGVAVEGGVYLGGVDALTQIVLDEVGLDEASVARSETRFASALAHIEIGNARLRALVDVGYAWIEQRLHRIAYRADQLRFEAVLGRVRTWLFVPVARVGIAFYFF